MNMMANKQTTDKLKSATNNNVNTSVSRATGNVETDLNNLRDDVSRLVDTVAKIGTNSVKSLKDRALENYDSARETGMELAEYVQTHAKDIEEQIVKAVKTQPVKALLIASATGLVLGWLFRR